jgi:hypothetical protein
MQEAKIGRIVVLGLLRQKIKVSETPISTEKSWVWWLMPFFPTKVGSIKYQDHGPGQPKKQDLM